MIELRFVFALSLIVLSVSQPPQQPVIGVYTQDAEDGYAGVNKTYIAASYVKHLEMAGAQVIPIYYHLSHDQLDALLPKLNGILFPGGEMPIDLQNQWTSNIAYILQFANRENEAKRPFPIWATCLSYEAIMYLHSGQQDNMTVLTEVNGEDGGVRSLHVVNENSKLLKKLTSEERVQVTTGEGAMYFHHRWAVTLDTYLKTTPINSFWRLITTSRTPDGVEFVSTVEAYNYPYFMTQYHPEKNAYEWRVPARRDALVISAAFHFIDVFMSYARMSPNAFPTKELQTRLISNFQPTLTPLTYSFLQIYLFDENKVSETSNEQFKLKNKNHLRKLFRLN